MHRSVRTPKALVAFRHAAAYSLAALALTLAAPTAAFSQEAPGSITGSVTDDSHRPLAGAQIRIEGRAGEANADRKARSA
jgi:hypothetical protein